ncbi:antitoxin Xre-like helix-turn-helix domain-containing protein [Ottowia sp.]|uniref:type II RES/Xre toxin-antitoxin system antitoxin n=1 Tax=Ottowia sp. TaxID=1898956 RepID=UPI003A87A794
MSAHAATFTHSVQEGLPSYVLRRPRLQEPQAKQGQMFYLSPIERAGLVKQGVPARTVAELSVAMGVPRDQLLRVLGLARSTVERKISAKRALSSDESEKLVGLARLIGQVAAMVGEGEDAPADFDAARWFARWMAEPAAALGGMRPDALLDTADGREAISHLLSQMKSGAYA